MIRASSKGKVVIPAALRKKLGIRKGTPLHFALDESARKIVVTPITEEFIYGLCGKFGDQPLVETLLKARKQDAEIEERKGKAWRRRPR